MDGEEDLGLLIKIECEYYLKTSEDKLMPITMFCAQISIDK